ncbi:MAG: alpha/beta fold hydrolase [Acidimicrobiia bacterium]
MEFTVDGRSVYAATGHSPWDDRKDSVVFLHGVGADHTVWVLPTRFFGRKGRNVLALDFPGSGRSEGPPLPTIEELAAWVVEVLDAAGIDKAAIVGHSMGALVSLAVAATRPDRVRGLVLLGVASPMTVSDELLDNAKRNTWDTVQMMNLWSHSRRAQIGGNDVPGIWMLGLNQRLLEQAKPGVIYAGLKACHEFASGVEMAGVVTCPTLFLLGSKDRMTPALRAKPLIDAAPQARSVVFADTGHALLAERPDEVLDELITIV